MNDETALALIMPYFLVALLYSILRFIYSVVITVAIYRDAKRRTFSAGTIAFLSFVIPLPVSAIYIIYVYVSSRNDPNIVKVKFVKGFKRLIASGYIIAVIDAFLFVLMLFTRGISLIAALIP